MLQQQETATPPLSAGRVPEPCSRQKGGVSWYHLLLFSKCANGHARPSYGGWQPPLRGHHRRGFHRRSACLAPTGRSLDGWTGTRLRVSVFFVHPLYQSVLPGMLYLKGMKSEHLPRYAITVFLVLLGLTFLVGNILVFTPVLAATPVLQAPTVTGTPEAVGPSPSRPPCRPTPTRRTPPAFSCWASCWFPSS